MEGFERFRPLAEVRFQLSARAALDAERMTSKFDMSPPSHRSLPVHV